MKMYVCQFSILIEGCFRQGYIYNGIQNYGAASKSSIAFDANAYGKEDEICLIIRKPFRACD